MDGDIALAKRKGAGSNVASPKGKVRKIPKPKISKLEADISKFTAQEQDELFARIVEQRKLQSSISLNEVENLESEEVMPFAKDIMATAALRIELGDVLQKQVELKAKEKKLKILIRKQERSIILASRDSEAPAATIEDVMREVFPTFKQESKVNLRETKKDSALWSLAKGAPIGDFENRRVQSERDCVIVEPTNYVTEVHLNVMCECGVQYSQDYEFIDHDDQPAEQNTDKYWLSHITDRIQSLESDICSFLDVPEIMSESSSLATEIQLKQLLHPLSLSQLSELSLLYLRNLYAKLPVFRLSASLQSQFIIIQEIMRRVSGCYSSANVTNGCSQREVKCDDGVVTKSETRWSKTTNKRPREDIQNSAGVPLYVPSSNKKAFGQKADETISLLSPNERSVEPLLNGTPDAIFLPSLETEKVDTVVCDRDRSGNVSNLPFTPEEVQLPLFQRLRAISNQFPSTAMITEVSAAACAVATDSLTENVSSRNYGTANCMSPTKVDNLSVTQLQDLCSRYELAPLSDPDLMRKLLKNVVSKQAASQQASINSHKVQSDAKSIARVSALASNRTADGGQSKKNSLNSFPSEQSVRTLSINEKKAVDCIVQFIMNDEDTSLYERILCFDPVSADEVLSKAYSRKCAGQALNLVSPDKFWLFTLEHIRLALDSILAFNKGTYGSSESRNRKRRRDC